MIGKVVYVGRGQVADARNGNLVSLRQLTAEWNAMIDAWDDIRVITAEMARFAHMNQSWPCGDDVESMARAIDTALDRRKKASGQQQVGECMKKKQKVGNAAAYRAALVKIRYYLPYMVQYMRIHWEDANAGGYFEKISSIIDAALAAPARACDYMNDPVDVIKAKWDAKFNKMCGVFPPLTRVIARQSAHAAIEAWFEPMTEDGADAEGEDE